MGSEKRNTRRLERVEDTSTFFTAGSPDSRKIVPYPIPTGTVTLPAPPPKQEAEDDGSDEDHAVREYPTGPS